jgi:F-type H+-transporting ATPase subunit a
METTHNEQEGSFFQIKEALPEITPHTFGSVGPFTIANTTTTLFFIIVLVAIVALLLRKSKLIPSTFQNICEYTYEAILGLVTQILGDEKKGKKVVLYVGAIMVYLAIANLLPLLPGTAGWYVASGEEHITLFRGVTTDFNTTFALALVIVLILQVIGVKEQGFFGYLSHFIQIKQVVNGFRSSVKDGLTALVGFFVGLIEIIGELAKTISLSLRLFGNMFAHEVLTIILLGAFAFGLPALWMG